MPEPDTLASRLPLTPDLQAERLAELKRLFPDLFDGEGRLKADDLKQLAGETALTREHYEFTWNGKRQAKDSAYRPATATLTFDAARSLKPEASGGNLIIEGENLESLKCLLVAYRDTVKCLYIDPPYNTGNDFVYSDDYSETRKAYWQDSGQMEMGVRLDSNPESAGRYHSNWLSMMYPRLLLARQLLRDDGVIFVSIDDHEVHNLRRLMEEVFGGENFVGTLVWQKSKKGDAKLLAKTHEYVHVFAKDTNSLLAQGNWRIKKPGAEAVLAHYDELRRTWGDNHEVIQVAMRNWYASMPKSDARRAHEHYLWSDARVKRVIQGYGEAPKAFICLERALDTTQKWNFRHRLGRLFTAF